MATISDDTPTTTYMEQAEQQDVFLRDKLTVIRRQFDSRQITEVEAAGLRIQAYSHHLLAAANLNHEFFGTEEQD